MLATGALARAAGLAFPRQRPAGGDAGGGGAVPFFIPRYGVATWQTGRRFRQQRTKRTRTASDLAAAGVRGCGVLIDSRPGVTGPADIPCFAGTRVTGTRGGWGFRGSDLEGPGRRAASRSNLPRGVGGLGPCALFASRLSPRRATVLGAEDIGRLRRPLGALCRACPGGAAAGVFSTAGCLAEGCGRRARRSGAWASKHPRSRRRVSPKTPATCMPRSGMWGPGAGLARPADDVTGEGRRACGRGRISSRIEHMKALPHARHGDDQGQGVERDGTRRSRRSDGADHFLRPERRRSARPTCRWRSPRWGRAARAGFRALTGARPRTPPPGDGVHR